MELTSEDKAAINESTGILYDTGSSAKERAAAQAELTSIFKRVGQDARDYQSSIMGSIKKGATENMLQDTKNRKRKSLLETAGKGMTRGGVSKMAYGGMSGGKKHMYVAGGSVKDNPGLKALRASGPKGMEAYKKITRSK
tara:strand:- start:188 stop:607 length:420 start_codon:yes stop_codon:yes gene_type:complete